MSLFSPQASWKTLSIWCRSMGTMQKSGVGLIKSLQIAGGQTTNPQFQKVMQDVVNDLRQGEDIATALKNQGGYFPELVTDMVQVAEHTGALPEVLIGLADHYENLIRLRKLFLGQIAWPMLQLFAAIFIIAALIFVLGMIADSQGGKPVDILGLGLYGGSGALLWLAYCFGSGLLLWIGYQFLIRGLKARGPVHRLLLRLPAIGNCLQSFAVARFAWAYALTQQAGMEIKPSLESSFNATSNGAFIDATPMVVSLVMQGEDLTDACQATGLFPPDVIEMMRVGETSGTVPETLQHLSPQFEDKARRAMSTLTMVLAGAIWMFVAAIIVYFIFRIFYIMYLGPLNEAIKGV